MRRQTLKLALPLLGGAIVLGLLALAWALGQGSSQAQDDTMYNCPQAGKWAIAVWNGYDGTDAEQALDTCGEGAVTVAYSIDPDTQSWLGYFADGPGVGNLTALNNMQGVVVFGAPSASPSATPAPPTGQGTVQDCPQPGKWAISVWDGQDGVGADSALASCGTGAVSAAYYLDPNMGSWLSWFQRRPEISSLTALNNLQGFFALGSGNFTLEVDKFGDGTVASDPAGIDCGADCTVQAAAFPSGTTVVLSATPDEGSDFSHWTGCDSVSSSSCTVKVDDDRAAFATFAYSEVIVPETTKALDEETMDHLTRQEGSTYYFDPEAAAVAGLAVGDVIVSDVGEGFLRKVAVVNVTEGEIAVETTDAALEDAIEQGTIIVRETLTAADLQAAGLLVSEPGLSANLGAPPAFGVKFSKELGGHKLTAEASFNLDLDVGISIKNWSVKEARAILRADNSASLTYSAEREVSATKEWEPWGPYKLATITVPVGPIALVFVPKLSFAARVDASAKAEVVTGVALNNTFAVGARYHYKTGWEIVKEWSIDFPISAADLTARAEVEACAGPELSLLLYGVGGPFFNLKGCLRASADLSKDPWWTLYGGIGAYYGFKVEIDLWLTTIKEKKEWPAWEEEWELSGAKTVALSVEKSGNGTVTSDPPGIDCGSDCFEQYDNKGQTVKLIAAPASGHVASWEGCTSESGNECSVTMDSSRIVTVKLERPKLDVVVDGPGSVTSEPSGIDCPDDCDERYSAGEEVTLTAEPDPDAVFVEWSCPDGSSSDNTCTVTMDANRSVVATFTHPTLTVELSSSRIVSVTSSPPGIDWGRSGDDPKDREEAYAPGEVVTLTAVAEAGWVPVWHGIPHQYCDGLGPGELLTGNTCTVTMDGNRDVVIEAERLPTPTPTPSPTATPPGEYRELTVEVSRACCPAPDSLSVISEPPGIDCHAPAECSAPFPVGQTVTLTAETDPTFAPDWQNCDSHSLYTCTVTMNSDRFVFVQSLHPQFGVTIYGLEKVGSSYNGGDVISDPPAVDCPRHGLRDEEWSSVTCWVSGGVDLGQEFTLTAIPDPGWEFLGFEHPYGVPCGSGNTCTVTIDEPWNEVVARFQGP